MQPGVKHEKMLKIMKNAHLAQKAEAPISGILGITLYLMYFLELYWANDV